MTQERQQPVKLSDLYQEVILDHNRHPRNYGKLEGASAYAHGVNPLCGDDFFVYLTRSGGAVQQVAFEGHGCAISKSSASLMTEAVKGKNAAEAERLKDDFIRLLTVDEVTDAQRKALGKLKIFEGVKNFPVRVKCATLAWRALEQALKGGNQAEVSTEK